MAPTATATVVEQWHQRADQAVTTRQGIDEFCGLRCIVVVGASRDPKHFPRFI
ncbi:MAG: hypothetical protein ACLQBX_18030 [Candidatus Limnocylindrales bacterium]